MIEQNKIIVQTDLPVYKSPLEYLKARRDRLTSKKNEIEKNELEKIRIEEIIEIKESREKHGK